MVPIKQQLTKYNHYDGGNTKKYIVIHGTGNVTDTAQANANYFCATNRGASAHYFVDDNNIIQIIKDDDCAWHCGDGKGKYGITNRNSISIEMCCTNSQYSQLTINNTIDLVINLMKKYNIKEDKIVRHYDASRKNCPSGFNKDGKWTDWTKFKKQLHDKLNPQPTSTNKPSDKLYGKVTASVLNVRNGRGTNYKIIGKLKQGKIIRLDKQIGDWWSIYYGEHGGFVSAKYIKVLK